MIELIISGIIGYGLYKLSEKLNEMYKENHKKASDKLNRRKYGIKNNFNNNNQIIKTYRKLRLADKKFRR